MKNKILKVLHSYKAIIIVLIIIVIFLMALNLYIIKSNRLYNFSGFDEDFTIVNGTIYTSLNINRFTSPIIIYKGEDIILSEYEIGYYINLKPISVLKSQNVGSDEPINLSLLIESFEFSFTEVHKNAQFLNSNNIKDIEKMHFMISGKDNKNKDIFFDIPLNVKKIR